MKIYKDLYVSEGLEHKIPQIIEKIKKEELQFNIYVIVLVEDIRKSLEIYNVALGMQHVFPLKDAFIIGIAKGHQNALLLIKEIVEDVYKENGDVDIRSYLLNKQRNFEESEV